MYSLVLLLHVLGATVWTGGHLVLALCILPRAWRRRDVGGIRNFESAYERIGIPALLIQVSTGLWMAFHLLPEWSVWINFAHPPTLLVWIKLGLLGLTALLGADARLRIIPKLNSSNIRSLAWYIIPATVTSVLFIIAGVAFRTGWLQGVP